MTKILLVEDNEDNRDMLSRRLERKDYTVALAVDGQDGVEKATEEKPDLILMDIEMPVMGGMEATGQIISYERNNHKTHIPHHCVLAYPQ